MGTPYIGISNETLSSCPTVRAGDEIACPHCGDRHKLEANGTIDGKPTDMLMGYKCGDKVYLGAINGRLFVGRKADVSGEI